MNTHNSKFDQALNFVKNSQNSLSKNPKLRTVLVSSAVLITMSTGIISSFSLTGLTQEPKPETNSQANANSENLRKVSLIKPSSFSSTSGSINLDGKIVQDNEVKIAAITSATVKSVKFTRGTEVKKGDVLITLGAKNGIHPLQAAYAQAQANLENLNTNLENVQSSNDNSVAKSEQQVKSLQSGLSDLQKTFDLTKDASKITIQSSEQSLKSLENDILRQEQSLNASSNQINSGLDQKKAAAKALVQQSATGLVTSLKSLQPLVNEKDLNTIKSLTNTLNGFETVNEDDIVDRLINFENVLRSVSDTTRDIVNNYSSIPSLSQSLSLVSTTAASTRSQAISQRASLENSNTDREASLTPGLNQLNALKEKRTDLQLGLDKATNATKLQEQATQSQINNTNQQIINANLLIDTAKIGAKTQTDSTEGQRKLLQIQAQAAASQLSALTITSPVNGIITDLKITQGEDVSVGRELVTVHGEGKKFVRFIVKPKDLDQIQVGNELDLNLAGESKTEGKAKINFIYPVADASTGLIPVDAEILSTENNLAFSPEVRVEGKINKSEPDKASAIYIPNRAIIIDGDKKYVLTVKDGKITRKEISTGPSEGDKVEITNGITQSDDIVSEASTDLKDGQNVTLN